VGSKAGFEVTIVVELGFDLGRARTQQRARAALARRDRVRRLPAPIAGSFASELAPLAAAEARALRAVLCEEPAQ
jgi:hypothetical protein